MEDKKIKQLEAKVTDYKQFGFILLSLSIFLFIGLVIPTESTVIVVPNLFIAGIFIALALAVVFHRLAMKAQKQLYEENTH
ncbi:YrhC family protein [Alkalihalobacillus sp. MEB130]|uniref:YrhC family protein n=1 Tax=Alkalihalobacillus sp. MEB130 TaxID=2976704 RepID=UPI0028DF92EF|nr:YrhC family protein [Alkalihalobacillus sp. MEB130]MDT8861499.1 YrhC family protein [Alkalihalobacillus sp. MEB130]